MHGWWVDDGGGGRADGGSGFWISGSGSETGDGAGVATPGYAGLLSLELHTSGVCLAGGGRVRLAFLRRLPLFGREEQ